MRTRRCGIYHRRRRRRADVRERHAHARVHLRAVEQLPGGVGETVRVSIDADEFHEKRET